MIKHYSYGNREKLIPCPFCEQIDKVITPKDQYPFTPLDIVYDKLSGTFVSCLNCHTDGPKYRGESPRSKSISLAGEAGDMHAVELLIGLDNKDKEEEAVRLWNQRGNSAAEMLVREISSAIEDLKWGRTGIAERRLKRVLDDYKCFCDAAGVPERSGVTK